MTQLECKADTRILLDNLVSRLYSLQMRVTDVAAALRQQWVEDEKELHRVLDEQNQVRVAHIRYMNLEDEAQRKSARLRRLAAFLVNKGDWEVAFKAGDLGIDVQLFEDKIPLWEAVAELLRHTSEIRIVDLHLLLRELYDKNVSRQAIDSALETHSEVFKFRRAGRDKFVSLK